MQATGSISRGKLATKHNLRTCYDGHNCPSNIDLSRSAENEVLVSRDIADVYAEAFGEALAAYNASQVEKRHPERQIPDYLEHVRADKKLNEAYEFVVQVGNIDERPPEALCAAILRDFESEFEKEHGERFRVIQAVIHMDEATPHMHMQVVPVAESKRGLAVQNSLNKAIEQSGFDDYKVMLMDWDETLTNCMEEHGVGRVIGDKERQRGGVDIDTYRNAVRVTKNIMAAEADMEETKRTFDAELAAAKRSSDARLAKAEQAEKAASRAVAVKQAELDKVERDIERATDRLELVRQEIGRAEVSAARAYEGVVFLEYVVGHLREIGGKAKAEGLKACHSLSIKINQIVSMIKEELGLKPMCGARPWRFNVINDRAREDNSFKRLSEAGVGDYRFDWEKPVVVGADGLTMVSVTTGADRERERRWAEKYARDPREHRWNLDPYGSADRAPERSWEDRHRAQEQVRTTDWSHQRSRGRGR